MLRERVNIGDGIWIQELLIYAMALLYHYNGHKFEGIQVNP